jgi:hypothetical protein
MTKKMRGDLDLIEIQPDRIYKTTLSQEIFGYGPQRTNDLIKKDKLPKPSPLSPGARFKAWTGQQILDHRSKMLELAAAEKPPSPQPPQFAKANAAKQKVKLRPPPTKTNRRGRAHA